MAAQWASQSGGGGGGGGDVFLGFRSQHLNPLASGLVASGLSRSFLADVFRPYSEGAAFFLALPVS